ncbi:MAG TPA: RNA polymerase sigma factor [Candidatus Limnocylindrales bacterium]|nr:RNA polymerase sigma factor [Candidatus Limnocylindrales bacterium]
MDRIVVEQARSGDRAAFARLATDLSHQLYPVAVRILRDPEAAGDAVQATLVDIWRDLPSLRDPDRMDAWAHRIVVNRCRSHLRKTRRLPAIVDLLEADRAAPSEDLSLEFRDELERAFARLSCDHRAVLVLVYFRDLTLQQSAALLGISVGTVKSRLFAARQAMRAAVDADARPIIQEGPA